MNRRKRRKLSKDDEFRDGTISLPNRRIRRAEKSGRSARADWLCWEWRRRLGKRLVVESPEIVITAPRTFIMDNVVF